MPGKESFILNVFRRQDYTNAKIRKEKLGFKSEKSNNKMKSLLIILFTSLTLNCFSQNIKDSLLANTANLPVWIKPAMAVKGMDFSLWLSGNQEVVQNPP